jgi:hypothetical protein
MRNIKIYFFLIIVFLHFGFTPPEVSKPESTYRVALCYYKNLAELFDYYSEVSNQKNINRKKFSSRILEDYAKTIHIYDEKGNAVDLLKMVKKERLLFFKSWIPSEAKKMNDKFKLDPKGNWVKEIKHINKVFKRKSPANNKTNQMNTMIQDPFTRIMMESEAKNKHEKAINKSNQTKQSGKKRKTPYKLSIQKFVDNIRSEIRRGRILVALPNGDYTRRPGVLLLNKNIYDVGHVAIIKLNSNDIPDTVSDTLSLTVGINSSEYMHHENLSDDWINKNHGRAYVLQVVYERWDKKDGKYILTTSDIDNDLLFEESLKYMDKEYCSPTEIFSNKRHAPKSFICSSAAWYFIKNSVGIDIDIPFYKYVWPASFLKSNYTRVVAKTWR